VNSVETEIVQNVLPTCG